MRENCSRCYPQKPRSKKGLGAIDSKLVDFTFGAIFSLSSPLSMVSFPSSQYSSFPPPSHRTFLFIFFCYIFIAMHNNIFVLSKNWRFSLNILIKMYLTSYLSKQQRICQLKLWGYSFIFAHPQRLKVEIWRISSNLIAIAKDFSNLRHLPDKCMRTNHNGSDSVKWDEECIQQKGEIILECWKKSIFGYNRGRRIWMQTEFKADTKKRFPKDFNRWMQTTLFGDWNRANIRQTPVPTLSIATICIV